MKVAPTFCDVLVCVGVIDQDESKSYVNELKKECDKMQAQPKPRQKFGFSFQDEFDYMRASPSVHIIDVRPWGAFTHSLNIAVGFAVQNGYDLILFMSLELKTTHELVRKLASCFGGGKQTTIDSQMGFSNKHGNGLKRVMSTNMTLVVGPCLPGHEFFFHNKFSSSSDVDNLVEKYLESEPPSILDILPSTEILSNCTSAKLPLRGRTCPWNTMAMWDVGKLALTGFPIIGDGGFYNKYNKEKENGITIIDQSVIDNDTNDSNYNHTTTKLSNVSQPLNKRSIKDLAAKGENNSEDLTTATDTDAKVFIKGGVEEVGAISLLQKIHPEYKAVLIDAKEGVDYEWKVNDFKGDDGKSNEVRKSWHGKKMATKDERPRLQMQMMGIPMGKVYHTRL